MSERLIYFGCAKLLIATQATQMITLLPVGDKMSAYVIYNRLE